MATLQFVKCPLFFFFFCLNPAADQGSIPATTEGRNIRKKRGGNGNVAVCRPLSLNCLENIDLKENFKFHIFQFNRYLSTYLVKYRLS